MARDPRGNLPNFGPKPKKRKAPPRDAHDKPKPVEPASPDRADDRAGRRQPGFNPGAAPPPRKFNAKEPRRPVSKTKSWVPPGASIVPPPPLDLRSPDTRHLTESPGARLERYGFLGASAIRARERTAESIAIQQRNPYGVRPVKGFSGVNQTSIASTFGVEDSAVAQAAQRLIGGADTVAGTVAGDITQLVTQAVPDLVRLTVDIGEAAYKITQPDTDPAKLDLYTKHIKPAIEHYWSIYGEALFNGDPSKLIEYIKNDPLFFGLDMTIVGGTIARTLSVGKHTADRLKETSGSPVSGRVPRAISEGFKRSYYPPGQPRVLRSNEGAVQVSRSRHPLVRKAQEALDAFSEKHPEAPLVGGNVRYGRALARNVRRRERRAYARAVPLARRIQGIAFPSIRSENKAARLRLYWESQLPPELRGDDGIISILEDLKAERDAPYTLPPLAETPELARTRSRVESLQGEYDKLARERDDLIVQQKLEPLKQEIRQLNGTLQYARARGEDTTAVEAQLNNAKQRLDSALGRDVPALDSPARTQLRETFVRQLGEDKADTILRFWDNWARTASPDAPERYYERIVRSTAGEAIPPDMVDPSTPNVLRQSSGPHWAPLTPREGSTRHTPVFASHLENVVAQHVKAKVSWEELKGIFKREGVKDAEAEYFEFEAWFAEKKANGQKSVSKEELQDYIAANHIELEETVLFAYSDPSMDDWHDRGLERTDPRWPTYRMHGGEHYKEFLLKLSGPYVGFVGGHFSSPPGANTNVIAHIRTTDREINGKRTLVIEELQSDWNNTAHQYGGYRENIRDVRARTDELNAELRRAYEELHNAQAQVEATHDELVSMKANLQGAIKRQEYEYRIEPGPEEGLVDLKRVTRMDLVENGAGVEAQMLNRWGDWEALPRNVEERRYYFPGTERESAERIVRDMEAERERMPQILSDWMEVNAKLAIIEPKHQAVEDLRREKLTLEAPGAPRDYPFSENWSELAMKRMIEFAARKGYEQLAWTVGRVHAARYGEYEESDYDDEDEGREESSIDKEFTLSKPLTELEFETGGYLVKWESGEPTRIYQPGPGPQLTMERDGIGEGALIRLRNTGEELRVTRLGTIAGWGERADGQEVRFDRWQVAEVVEPVDTPYPEETPLTLVWESNDDGEPSASYDVDDVTYDLKAFDEQHGTELEEYFTNSGLGMETMDITVKWRGSGWEGDDHYGQWTVESDELGELASREGYISDLERYLRELYYEWDGGDDPTDIWAWADIETHEPERRHPSSADDLTLTGAGERKVAFYDERLPLRVRNIPAVKKAGVKPFKAEGYLWDTTAENSSLDMEGSGIWVLPINDKLRKELDKGPQKLFQAMQGDVKGAVELLGNKQFALHLFEGADTSTAIHELAHIGLFDLDGDDLAVVEQWAGARLGDWTKEHHEKWAKAVERYVLDNKTPTPALKQVMQKLAAWLKAIYQSVQELGIEVSPELRQVLDKRFGRVTPTDEDIVKYAGRAEGHVRRIGGALSVEKDRLQRLEKIHARRELRRTLPGLRKAYADLEEQWRKRPDDEELLARLDQLGRQLAEREELDYRFSQRREKELGKRIAELERALKYKPDKRYEAALDAARTLSAERDAILLEAFGEGYEETLESGNEVMARRLGMEGRSDIHMPHRSTPVGLRGTIAGGRRNASTTIGRTATTRLNATKQNQLVLYRQGRINPDPDHLIESWMRAQSYGFLSHVKQELAKAGEPIPLGGRPNPGWYVVNPNGKALPTFWKDAEEGDLNSLGEGLRGYLQSFLGKEGEDLGLRDPESGMYYDGVVQVSPQIVEQLFHRMSSGDVAGTSIGTMFDLTNGLVKLSLLYLNPAYIPSNLVGNLAFLGLHQGAFAIDRLLRAGKMLLTDPELAALVKAETGTNATLGVSQEPGRGQHPYVQAAMQAERATARTISQIPDNWPRMAAWIHEARKAGFKTRARMMTLLTDPELEAERNDISSRATEVMVNFDRLAPWEKTYLQRVFFVWPWVRGATAWAGYYSKEYPERVGLAGAEVQATEEDEDDLGPLPSNLSQAVGLDVDGRIATISNLKSVSPSSTAYELGETMVGAVKSAFTDEPMPRDKTIWDMTNPILDMAVRGMMGVNEFGGAEGLQSATTGFLEGVSPHYRIYRDMTDGRNPKSPYVDQDWEDVAVRSTLRFAPQRVDLQKLHQKAARENHKPQESTPYTREKEFIKRLEKVFPEGIPAEVLRHRRNKLLFEVSQERLKEDLGVKKLTYKQKVAVKAAVLLDQYPHFRDSSLQQSIRDADPKTQEGLYTLQEISKWLNKQLFAGVNWATTEAEKREFAELAE